MLLPLFLLSFSKNFLFLNKIVFWPTICFIHFQWAKFGYLFFQLYFGLCFYLFNKVAGLNLFCRTSANDCFYIFKMSEMNDSAPATVDINPSSLIFESFNSALIANFGALIIDSNTSPK